MAEASVQLPWHRDTQHCGAALWAPWVSLAPSSQYRMASKHRVATTLDDTQYTRSAVRGAAGTTPRLAREVGLPSASLSVDQCPGCGQSGAFTAAICPKGRRPSELCTGKVFIGWKREHPASNVVLSARLEYVQQRGTTWMWREGVEARISSSGKSSLERLADRTQGFRG